MPVKCAECGFLAVLHRITGEYISPGEQFRVKGNIPSGNGYIHDALPYCVRDAIDFSLKIGPRNPDNEGGKRAEVMNELRDCGEFEKWIPGLSPKDHQQMIQERELREWQTRREEADRVERAENARRQQDAERERNEYQTTRDKQNHDFQAEQARQARAHSNRMFLLSACGLVLAIGTALASSVLWFLGKK